jgi:hypothetical protein
MSIQLKLNHEDGLRLRSQTAHTLERGPTGHVMRATDWKFTKYTDDSGHPTEEVPQDRDPRRVGADGKKVPLGTYTVHVTHNQHNLVVERKGKIAPYNFKNPAIRNQMRIRYQELKEKLGKDGKPVTKDGKQVFEWKDSAQPPQYIAPNTFGGVYVGDGQRAILEEMPT